MQRMLRTEHIKLCVYDISFCVAQLNRRRNDRDRNAVSFCVKPLRIFKFFVTATATLCVWVCVCKKAPVAQAKQMSEWDILDTEMRWRSSASAATRHILDQISPSYFSNILHSSSARSQMTNNNSYSTYIIYVIMRNICECARKLWLIINPISFWLLLTGADKCWLLLIVFRCADYTYELWWYSHENSFELLNLLVCMYDQRAESRSEHRDSQKNI